MYSQIKNTVQAGHMIISVYKGSTSAPINPFTVQQQVAIYSFMATILATAVGVKKCYKLNRDRQIDRKETEKANIGSTITLCNSRRECNNS